MRFMASSVCSNEVPAGISRLTTTSSPSTTGKKINRTCPPENNPVKAINIATKANTVTHGARIASFTTGMSTQSRRPKSIFSIYCRRTSIGPTLHGLPCARCAGRIRNTSTSETRSTPITTSGTGRRICPSVPDDHSSGANTIIVVAIPTSTGTSTLCAPTIASASLSVPRLCFS